MYSTSFVDPHSPFLSSPPSSPSSTGPSIDTSPPASSPGPDHGAEIYHEHDILSISLTRDPFSASKDNWKPPEYEKKRSRSPITPSTALKKLKYHIPSEMDTQLSPTNSTYLPQFTTVMTSDQVEAEIWEKASESIIDEGNGRVSLENCNLTSIPESFIEVLSHFWTSSERSDSNYVPSTPRTSTVLPVTRPLNRAATEPAGADIWGRPMLRTQSVATVPLGLPKNKIQLFLSNNNLTVVPLSLFRAANMENLTILSLRNNQLAHIPPEIVQLRGLEELSIGQNHIQYLPAELQQMTLKSLYLFPNPFLPPPPSSDPCSLGSSTISRKRLQFSGTKQRQVSETILLNHRVPSLNELLLRLLLSPIDPTKSNSESVLEAYYVLPLPEEMPVLQETEQLPLQKVYFSRDLPPFVRRTLNLLLPGSVYLEEDTDAATIRSTSEMTGVGLCSSPKHQRLCTPRLFIQHAEERYTWETMIAGVEVGGSVPIRWRGCQRGCLNFLDPSGDNSLEETIDLSQQVEDDNLEDVVKVVQLGIPGTGELEEFDDE
ncbi:hypothetical protein C0993_010771 [Termitomyces sp. T159_Od127]|nr:hypothetical protein C0993_010771 [Termitomyces sp. T159_Od127]